MAAIRSPRRSMARTTIDVDPDWLEGEEAKPSTRKSQGPRPKLPSKMPPVPPHSRRSATSQTIEVDPNWVYEDEPAKDDAPPRPAKKSLRPPKSPPSLPPTSKSASKTTSKAPPRPSRRPRPPPIPRDE